MPTDELPCVTGLSSDSSVEWEPQVKARPKKRARSKKLPAVADESELDGKAAVEAALRKTLTKSCPCKTRQCFNVFREDAKFADLLELRLDWNNLHKLDQDRMVFDRIREKRSSLNGEWQILDEPVCLKGWKRLHGIGSKRFSKIHKAVSAGQLSPPVDLRYLKKPHASDYGECRADIVSFLSEIYTSVAETLPDYRDDSYDVATSLELVKKCDCEEDPYGDLVPGKGQDLETTKKPKNTKRSVQINPGRVGVDSGGAYEEKWLPPGQMKEYWELYKQKHRLSSKPCASFATFWKATTSGHAPPSKPNSTNTFTINMLTA
ncbi:FO synthase subunit 1 [Durusdinium trenchii]|uniref:FO synthase subunit 1 n=1 Tax=Durusdinium trenchii TaxID=1381693 RepID=A0ABP0IGC5_9DINO